MKYTIELSDEQVAGVSFAMSKANENSEKPFADEQEYVQSVVSNAADSWVKSSPQGEREAMIAKLKEMSADDPAFAAKLAKL